MALISTLVLLLFWQEAHAGAVDLGNDEFRLDFGWRTVLAAYAAVFFAWVRHQVVLSEDSHLICPCSKLTLFAQDNDLLVRILNSL